MDRRVFIGAGAALVYSAPHIARTQTAKSYRIGFLGNGSPITLSSQYEAFLRSLRELGWIEGPNLVIEKRWADGNPDRLPALVAELLRARVDVVVLSGTPAMRAAQNATKTVPIVFVVLTDPVTMGFMPSLAHPGGNMTGVASQFEELITKQLQLLKEGVSNLSRVALLRYSGLPTPVLTAAESAARSLGLTVRIFNVTGSSEFDNAFKGAKSEGMGAILVMPSPYFEVQRIRLIELAGRYSLPACYELSTYVRDGGLMSYGPSIDAMYGRSASYVDRILKGANPAICRSSSPASSSW